MRRIGRVPFPGCFVSRNQLDLDATGALFLHNAAGQLRSTELAS